MLRSLLIVLAICLSLVKTTCYAQIGMYVGAAATVKISAVNVAMTGNLINNGTVSGNASSGLVLNGSAITQTIGGTATNSTTIGQIDIQNTSGASLGTNVEVNGTTGLVFTSGAISLSNNNLTFSNGSTWSGNNTTTKFFVTNGTGLLYLRNSGSAVTYPIGFSLSAANYQPLTLTNTGTTDVFGVRVMSGLNNNYNSSNGSASGSPKNSNGVGMAWVVNETVSGGSTISITAKWDAADELLGFNRNMSALSYYDYASAAWVASPVSAASGSGPYTQSRTGLTVPMNMRVFGIGDNNSLLPIELLSFTAEANDNDAILNWSTAMELNNDHFELERSPDGVNFEAIGTVEGKGNATAIQNYTFTDTGIGSQVNGTVYYQLRQVDKDGTSTTSKIRSVQFTNKHELITVNTYPNPVVNELHLDLTALISYASKLAVRIVNVNGALVNTAEFTNFESNPLQTIDLSTLAGGTYFIQLSTEHNQFNKTITIVKI